MTRFFEKFRPPSPIAWFFFLFGFATTIALGTWQVERLQWKTSIRTQLDAARALPPREMLPKDEAELAALQFTPVRVRGTWLGDTEFHIAPRYLHDQFGYALITPLKLADGRIVLVNRGWIPGSKKELQKRPETKVKGKTTLTGMVRVGADRSYFTPVSQPEKNIWFGRDIPEMAAYAKLENVVPVMIDQTAANGPEKPSKKSAATGNEPTLPIPSDGTIKLRNDHLGYIITWYGLALGMLVVFALAHRRK